MTLQELIDQLEAAKSVPGITPDATVYRNDSEYGEVDIVDVFNEDGEVTML